MGRPLLGSTERRRNAIHAYLTDREYDLVYRIAIKEDRRPHLSAWFREIILKELEKKEAGRDP